MWLCWFCWTSLLCIRHLQGNKTHRFLAKLSELPIAVIWMIKKYVILLLKLRYNNVRSGKLTDFMLFVFFRWITPTIVSFLEIPVDISVLHLWRTKGEKPRDKENECQKRQIESDRGLKEESRELEIPLSCDSHLGWRIKPVIIHQTGCRSTHLNPQLQVQGIIRKYSGTGNNQSARRLSQQIETVVGAEVWRSIWGQDDVAKIKEREIREEEVNNANHNSCQDSDLIQILWLWAVYWRSD